MSDEEKREEQPTWRPLTPEEQEAIRKAYRPYEDKGFPSVAVIYNKPKLSAKEVLQIFEERRKTDRKLQLKALCEELGANYKSILAAKSRLAKEKRKRGPYKKK